MTLARIITVATALVALAPVRCTEPNPYYDAGGADVERDAEDVEIDVDVRPDADGDLPDEPEAEADREDGVEPDVEGDTEIEENVEPDADGDVEEIGEDGTDETAPGDTDGDGVPDASDNCPSVWNPGQEDCDGDTIGDRCEAGDSDGDTLLDEIDVCPCGGGGTHDEDGDTLADDCDNCPLVANPGQENANLDGLGDACVPPSAPDLLMRIDRFEPFLAVPTDPGWVEDAGTWAIGADVYSQTHDTDHASAFYDPWDRGDDYFVQATFDVAAFGAGGGVTKRAGVVARATTIFAGGVQWYSCIVETQFDRLEIDSWNGSVRTPIARVDVSNSLDLGPYRLSFLVLGNHLACALEAPGTAPVVLERDHIAYPIGAPGVRAFRLLVDFAGMMVAVR